MYLNDIFTVPVNLGIPAISIPAGQDNQGRPLGLQHIKSLEEQNLKFSFCNGKKYFFQTIFK